MTATASSAAWSRFWQRGRIWKAIILAAAYYAVYELLGLAIGLLIGAAKAAHCAENREALLMSCSPPLCRSPSGVSCCWRSRHPLAG